MNTVRLTHLRSLRARIAASGYYVDPHAVASAIVRRLGLEGWRAESGPDRRRRG